MNSRNTKRTLHPTVVLQRQQLAKDKILSEILDLGTQADRLPPGNERAALVDRIADLNVRYQSED
ncbi:MAG: hypothetical protein ACLPLZ_16785 [Terracidiphilus sp.]